MNHPPLLCCPDAIGLVGTGRSTEKVFTNGGDLPITTPNVDASMIAQAKPSARWPRGRLPVVLLVAVSATSLAGQSPDEGAAATDAGWFDLDQLLAAKVYSVSRREQVAFEVPAAVHVIQGEDLARFGARSFAEALRLAPGTFVGRMNSHRYAVSIRGFADEFANKLLVMQDGRSLYTPHFSGTFWDVQDTFLDDIDQIEVVRGPGGAAWGVNAVNGVVNVLTKSAEKTQGLLVTGGGGTEEMALGGVRYGGRAGEHTYYRVFGQAFQRGDTKLANGESAHDEWYQARGGFRVDSAQGDANRFRMLGEYYAGEEDQLIFSGPDMIEVSGGHVIGGWQHDFSPDSLLDVQAYYDGYRRSSGQGISDADQFSLALDHSFLLGEQHRLNWGVDYRAHADSLVTPPQLVYAPTERTLQFLSIFAQDEWALIDELKLTMGVKAEHNDFTGWEPLPNLRFAWTPTERQTVWTGVSRAARIPSRTDDNQTVFLPGFEARPNTELPTEQLWAYEAGYRARFGEDVTLDAAVFLNQYDNLRTIESSFIAAPPTFVTLRDSKMTGQGYGGELALLWQATKWWRWQGAYSYLELDLATANGSTDTTSTRQSGNSPQQQVMIRSWLDFSAHLRLDAAWRWVDDLPSLNVPAYNSLDVRLAWEPTAGLWLSVVGQNLLAEQHPEFRSSPFLPISSEIQRGVYAKLAWEF